MIKKIALAGIFVVVSAFSVAQATAVTTAKPSSGAPTAPVPRGICPIGIRC